MLRRDLSLAWSPTYHRTKMRNRQSGDVVCQHRDLGIQQYCCVPPVRQVHEHHEME